MGDEQTGIELGSAALAGGLDAMQSRTVLLDAASAAARAGGGERSLGRHRARGKLFVHDRIAALVDEDTTPLQMGTLAALGMYGGAVPGGGIVTALVQVAGRWCVVIANDATVKGGTYFPASTRAHLRAQEIAMQLHLPCIYLVDSGGAHLPLQAELFADRDHGGRFFFNQAAMSALAIPQVACIMGSCTAGGAYVPAMSDETVIVRGTGTVFLAGPPLVAAATGEIVSAEELGGAVVHTGTSGLADHLAENDRHALGIVRNIIAASAAAMVAAPTCTPIDPAPDAAVRIDALVGARSNDQRAVLECLVDDGQLHEFKSTYGTGATCAFARVGGWPVGLLAVRASMSSDACDTAAHHVELCAQRALPLVLVYDGERAAGDAALREHDAGSAATPDVRHGARLLTVLARMATPVLTIATRLPADDEPTLLPLGAWRSAGLWLWPWSDLPAGEAGSDAAALAALADLPEYVRAARVQCDGVVPPSRTRDVLIAQLAAASTSALHAPTVAAHGVIRF